MAEHIFNLLGTVNHEVRDVTVREKYVVRVTADQLAGLLHYDRKGSQKAAPFRITPTSAIRIDKKIQRGTDDAGFLQQQPSKILDIAKTLLGDASAAMRFAYLGSLVWNVRKPGGTLEVIELQRPPVNGQARPPEFRLRVDTESFYLTDSAHRHFGIVEALKMWKQKPSAYPRFKPNIEFTVEIYNLDAQGEHELFYELNGKQKKASPTKLRELDVSSPIGALRNAILAHDSAEAQLLENNIEVTSVQNKHTLMTMSVFVSTIAEMFTNPEIKEAREEEDSREDFAQYYCDFLYKLAETLVVKCDVNGDGQDEEVHPYWNLHSMFIKPAIDAIQPESPEESQKHLAAASDKAKLYNDRLRARDIANNNATMKALFRIGGRIRLMPNWQTVLDRLQNDLVVPADGKFFQRNNTDWFASTTDMPIAALNDDESMNIQVQPKTINKLYAYLCDKLELNHPALVSTMSGGGTRLLGDGAGSFVWELHRQTDNIKTFELRFIATRSTAGYEDVLRLAIECDTWKQANFKGNNKIAPTSVQEDQSYQHQAYPDLVRFTAYFEVKLPPAVNDVALKLTFQYPDIDRSALKKVVEVEARVVD